MSNGIVKFYNDARGYGFIKEANSDNEYFMHSSGLIDKIKINDSVTFDVEKGKKGMNAENVKVV
jgi:CspA family cold shock protein